MRIKAIKDEAEKLVREHGAQAKEVALEAAARAKRQRNLRMEHFMGKVALEAARLSVRSSSAEAERSSPAPSPHP